MFMRYNVTCGLSGWTIFFVNYFIKCTIFEKKYINIIEHKNESFEFLYNFYLEHFSF
jgi:hypothetical protein